jgi:hypothetical protein
MGQRCDRPRLHTGRALLGWGALPRPLRLLALDLGSRLRSAWLESPRPHVLTSNEF